MQNSGKTGSFCFSDTSVREVPSFAPKNTCIYAIGDIHGRVDLLHNLHELIKTDASANTSAKRKCIVYIGDYIDRGFDSKTVIDTLIDHPMKEFETVFLLGNHEYIMLEFLNGNDAAKAWLLWGGEATLRSYGVSLRDSDGTRMQYKTLREKLLEKIPPAHIDFLKSLKISHTEGDYMFVHAGIKPGIPIRKQRMEDMIMIREEFIHSQSVFEKTVVFGHTIFDAPFIDDSRIGIDTGAFATGRLTAAVLESNQLRFINT